MNETRPKPRPEGADQPRGVPLRDRIALSIPEAAALLGLSERSLRDHLLADLPKFYAGRRLLIPRRGLEEWVEKRARAESGVDKLNWAGVD